MQKYVSRVLWITCLANLIFLGLLVFSQRPSRASAKKTYKSEVVVGWGAVQPMLDQRASEGWHLVSAAGYTYPNGTSTEAATVLIFDKE